MQEGIEIIDKCTECGRTWDKDGQVQITPFRIFITREFICGQCEEVYREEGKDLEECDL